MLQTNIHGEHEQPKQIPRKRIQNNKKTHDQPSPRTDMTMHNSQIQELKALAERKEIKGWTNNTFLLERSTPEAFFVPV